MPAAAHTILLVDDEEPNRVLISRRLSNEGYLVNTVSGGRQAIEALKVRRFDLVLLDLMMPEMNGVATLREIRADPHLHGMPVLMLTASHTRESVMQCLQLGAADYLIKPVDPADLKRRVERQLKPSGTKA